MGSEDRPPGPPRASGVELVQDISRISSPVDGFLRRHRHRAKTQLEDGRRTDTYVVDFVDRAPGRRDAVVVAAFVPPPAGAPAELATVLFRRQLRYPVHMVTGEALFTELVAGILEDSERPEDTATRELAEEAGIEVSEDRPFQLGASFFIAPGAFTERMYVVAVALTADELEHASLHHAPGDGSPLEEGAELVSMNLGDAIALATSGDPIGDVTLHDMKTELALRRLLEHLARPTR